MTNWKTTICGLVSAAASFIVLHPDCCSKTVDDIAAFILAGGLIALGVAAKDATNRQ